MSVPMSQYEDVLEEVRCLGRKAQHVQKLAAPLISTNAKQSSSTNQQLSTPSTSNHVIRRQNYPNPRMNSIRVDLLQQTKPPDDFDEIDLENGSEDEFGHGASTHMSVSSEPISQKNRGMANLYHGTWPVEKTLMWNSEPTNLGPITTNLAIRMDQTSVMSFASSSGGAPLDRVLSSPDRSRRSSQQLEAKMDMVYSLLAMLGGQEHADMGETLLALSISPESCVAMRQSGCIPLLVQLVQSENDADTRKKASQALSNLVHSQSDEKLKKRETRVLKLLEQTRMYTEALRNNTEYVHEPIIASEDGDKHPVLTVAHLMKVSFDEGHRQAICQLGGIYITANLVETEHSIHGSTSEDTQCVLMRRYACMALTNLTFGDSGNKALLCSFREFMRALVIQLQSPSDELRQVTASVLRNLSWRADSASKQSLREVGTVTGLMKAAMIDSKENTLKSILSALWNLSAHCTENKAEICAIDGALGFLVDMLSYKSPSKSLAVIENSGGILRNISSQVAVRQDYRDILRHHNCLQVLLDQLKSPSLTIVSNACGTLWNLSAKNAQDQEALWQMGAPSMLRSLNHSKHKMIAMGSSAALKNLLSSRPSHSLLPQIDATAKAMDLPVLPTLGARKQKALLQDLDQSLHETCDNLESPTKSHGEELSKKSFFKTQLKNDYMKVTNELCCGFASINLNEPSTSNYLEKNLTQNFGSSFMPYSQKRGTYIPVRNNYADCSLEYDEDSTDQPIDFSRKYPETKRIQEKPAKKYLPQDTSYGIYAETDLDQPTDYSLRYAEDDSDSDVPQVKNEFVQDTVKTYCTEGTPYETPLNFSTATSMSDLRIENNEKAIDNDDSTQTQKEVKNVSLNDEKDHCSIEDISEIETRKTNEKVLKAQFSSGLMSPEKPVNYCEEGTPGYFSRVSSFGSLNSIPPNDSLKVKQVEKVGDIETVIKSNDLPNEVGGKAVKFEETVNYAQETPLMFSRSSSLASLDSIEQHSIHDDRSSVISDFSRLTSGIVSPSELPDSPSQTVPPSPRPRKVPLEYPSTSRVPLYPRTAGDGRPQPAPRSLQKSSIFEDNVTKFKEESTPVQFSTATSLSSLTIDDHDDTPNLPLKVTALKHQGSESPLSNVPCGDVPSNRQIDEKQDTEQEKRANISSDSNDELHISENEEDEDILADCINMGMQNRRHKSEDEPTPTNPIFKYVTKLGRGSGIPLPRSTVPSRLTPQPILPVTTSRHEIKPLKETGCDTTTTYCTEDTPAVLSHAGSQSDLSILSMSIDAKSRKGYLSDDSSNLSADNENILAECIASGMPKAKSKLPSKITSTPVKYYKEEMYNKKSYLTPKDEIQKFAVENSPCQFSLRSSLSDLTLDGSIAGLTKIKSPKKEEIESNNQNLSRQESLSSLSVDSVGSFENEQALLEQCISSGMPQKAVTLSEQYPEKIKYYPKENSKNVSAASVVANTLVQNQREERPARTARTADVDASRGNLGIVPREKTATPGIGTIEAVERRDVTLTRKFRAKRNGSDETTTNNNFDKLNSRKTLQNTTDGATPEKSYSNSDNLTEDHELDSAKEVVKISNRMLDPEAMIESLDRFTAELVFQAQSHLEHKEEKFQNSVTDGDTWNDISPNEVSFPSISGSVPNIITFSDSRKIDEVDGIKDELKSNDFSSMETTTMTESTLIAMEATRMAKTFKIEAMGHSTTSLELDLVQPPSHFNSLTNSVHELEIKAKRSPKLASRKQSLPVLMMKKAFSNSLNHASSLESLENQSLSNLDHMNPPSLMADMDVLDLESSLTSVASLQSEVTDLKPDFLVNGVVTNEKQNINPIFNVKIPYLHSNYSEIENVNPPSIFNEITDLCNSLADIPTEAICSETEVFEDCFTHTQDNLQTDNDVTLFSDANSATPLQSDQSSNESTPRKRRSLTPKERRSIAKERYKTYTIDLEDVLQKENDETNHDVSEIEDYNTCLSETYTANTSKLTPKERRLNNRARFETQVLNETTAEALVKLDTTSSTTFFSAASQDISNQNINGNSSNSNSLDTTPMESPPQSPKAKSSIRKSFLQKRLENRDRFKTKVIKEINPNPNSPELHYMLQKEANMVLKTLNETKTKVDELIDCETLSLVSNEEDSEHNSGGSINYRTYHKSWGVSAGIIPVVKKNESNIEDLSSLETNTITDINTEIFDNEMNSLDMSCLENEVENSDSENSELKRGKPKIVKPGEKKPLGDEQPKPVRGHRKSLYHRSALKPLLKQKITPPTLQTKFEKSKTVSTPKSPTKPTSKPPYPQALSKLARPSTVPKITNAAYPKHSSPVRAQNKSPMHPSVKAKPPNLERQGTFIKEEKTMLPGSNSPKTTTPTSAIPKPSRIAKAISQTAASAVKPINKTQSTLQKLKSGIKPPNGTEKPKTVFRSPSADARDITKRSSLQPSSSSQSLKNGAVKKSSMPEPSLRTSSNGSLTSTNTSSKQITSRIASLWKKVEDTKKLTNKTIDKRIWIQSENKTTLIRSNTFDNKESLENAADGTTKRVSRLGSFVVVEDETGITGNNTNRQPEITY